MARKRESSIRIWASRGLALTLIVMSISQGIGNRPKNVYTFTPVDHIAIRPATLQRSTPEKVKSVKRVKVTRPKRVTNEVLCLAQNIFFESAYEPVAGIEAVAAVVFNRMSSDAYPHTVCGVVYQAAQFSWTADYAKWRRVPPQKYIDMAKTFLQNRAILRESYENITHFHHVSISPAWSKQLQHVKTYGQHKFYAHGS